MTKNTSNEEIIEKEQHTKSFLIEEIHPNSITTDCAVSLNTEETDIQIENTSSTSIVASEVIGSEQIEGSNRSQNMLPINQIDAIKEGEHDDKDKRVATVIPTVSTVVSKIGSLGLLCQYASSSDETNDTEDEDTNCDATETSMDSIKNKTESLAKSILDNALSQGGYRGVNAEMYVY